MYDNYVSENDYRSSKQGIEKLNLENPEKYRRQTELEHDEMSMERFRTQSQKSKLDKQAARDTEKQLPTKSSKPQQYESKNSA